jgi:hypothetical protein
MKVANDGVGRKCQHCGMIFFDMERYGDHLKNCTKKT